MNYRDSDNSTALMFAAASGSDSVIKMFIKYNALLNAQNQFGYSALMFASSRGHLNAAKELLVAGAAVNLKDMYGFSALAIALEFMTEKKDTINLLVEYGVDLEDYVVNIPSDVSERRTKLLDRLKTEEEEFLRLQKAIETDDKKDRDYMRKLVNAYEFEKYS